MRLLATLGALVLAATPASADPKPTEAKVATPCKRVVVGRGLERRVFCELATPIVVKAGPAKPQVAIVHHDGRAVVGPTRTTDPFAGLSHQLR